MGSGSSKSPNNSVPSTPLTNELPPLIQQQKYRQQQPLSTVSAIVRLPQLNHQSANKNNTSALQSKPYLSTNSWHSPTLQKRPNNDNARSSSATHKTIQPQRLPVTNDQVTTTSLNRIRSNANQKRHDQQIDNNIDKDDDDKRITYLHKKYNAHINHGIASATSKISRARSDGHLLKTEHASIDNNDDKKITINNWDEMPIRPTKNDNNHAVYDDYEIARSEPQQPSKHQSPLIPLNRKSNSHSNINTADVANKKPFLQRGTSIRKSQSTKPTTTNNKKYDLPPKNPEQLLATALKKISNEEWTEKVDGLTTIQNLCTTSPNTVGNELHTIVMALIDECKNLRSSVSRAAITCIGALFVNLRTKMDAELEKTCHVLMQKSGDVSSAFIRDDAFQSLEYMVNNASSARVCTCLIASGANSKTNTIRTGCGLLLSKLVDKIGATSALNNKEISDKLIPQAVQFCNDQHPQVRYYGKMILQLLSKDATNFDRTIRRVLNDSEVRNVKDILDNINKKGLGESTIGFSSIATSPESTLSSTTTGTTQLARNGSIRKANNNAPMRKLPDNVQLDLDEIRSDLCSTNWETRSAGLARFKEMCTTSAKSVASDTNLIEAFIGRLNDINSKVAIEGIETHLRTLPQLAKYYSSEAPLKAVLDQLVRALIAHLPCKNDEIRTLSQTAIDATCKYIDPSCLILPFASAAKTANVKQKPYILITLARLSQALYKTKPKQVEVNALPVLWDLMKSRDQSDTVVKHAVSDYANSLAKVIGKRSLLEATPSTVTPNQKIELETMIAAR